MSIATLEAPAVGARYRGLLTNRAWHVHRVCESGLICLTDDRGGGWEVRGYVTSDELSQNYTPVT